MIRRIYYALDAFGRLFFILLCVVSVLSMLVVAVSIFLDGPTMQGIRTIGISMLMLSGLLFWLVLYLLAQTLNISVDLLFEVPSLQAMAKKPLTIGLGITIFLVLWVLQIWALPELPAYLGFIALMIISGLAMIAFLTKKPVSYTYASWLIWFFVLVFAGRIGWGYIYPHWVNPDAKNPIKTFSSENYQKRFSGEDPVVVQLYTNGNIKITGADELEKKNFLVKPSGFTKGERSQLAKIFGPLTLEVFESVVTPKSLERKIFIAPAGCLVNRKITRQPNQSDRSRLRPTGYQLSGIVTDNFTIPPDRQGNIFSIGGRKTFGVQSDHSLFWDALDARGRTIKTFPAGEAYPVPSGTEMVHVRTPQKVAAWIRFQHLGD